MYNDGPPKSICQRICKAQIFDETLGVNRAFNSEVFVAAPHAVGMEDLFGRGGVVIGLRKQGLPKGKWWGDKHCEL